MLLQANTTTVARLAQLELTNHVPNTVLEKSRAGTDAGGV